jgi:small-conductance mechanosensitive channel
MLAFFVSFPATAQELPTVSMIGAASEAVIEVPTTLAGNRDTMAVLPDAEVRRLLLAKMDAEVAIVETGSQISAWSYLTSSAAAVKTSVYDGVAKLPNLYSVLQQSSHEFVVALSPGGALKLVATLAISLLVSWFVSMFLERKLSDSFASKMDGEHAKISLQFLFYRFMREVFGTLVLLILTLVISDYYLHEQLSDYAETILFNLLVVPRVGWMLSRFLLAPHKPEMRLLNIQDKDAERLHRYFVGLFLLLGFAGFLTTFSDISGVPLGESGFGFWTNFLIHIYLISMLWANKTGLQDMMSGNAALSSPSDQSFAAFYPYFGILSSIGLWLIVKIVAFNGHYELLQGQPHYITMSVLLAAPVLDTAIRATVLHFTSAGQYLLGAPISRGAERKTAHYAIARGYVRIARLVITITAIFAISAVWEVDLRNLTSAGVGVAFAGRVFEVAMILSFGYLLSECASLLINRKMMSELPVADNEDAGLGDEGGAGGSRIVTVLPLISVTLQIFLFVLFGLLALSQLGVDTTPLLAGAGIVGLAVGFGAQKLVADIVSGVFFLIDDAFRTGEYVEVGATMGTVERISIRSMQLRHHRGPVHTIPFGEIPKITNYSRDWVILKLKFTVPFETDPNKVKKIFKKIGAEMGALPEFSEDFLQPFKSQGVFEVNDVGMVIRGKFMAKPGKQFMIRKEIYNRVKAEFTANGIEFARREVRVALPDNIDTDISAENAAVIKAAAAQSAVPDPVVPPSTPSAE